jgi:hypothetical protein
LPRLENLIEQYKDRKDVVILSLNIDENPGLIAPIMAEQKLTFAVLPAYSYVNDQLKLDFIPQNWIVGPDGIVRLKGIGSYESMEKWEPGMKEAIEKVRSASQNP